MGQTIHYILIGGSGTGSRRIAEWIKDRGWFYLYERRIALYLDKMDGVWLRCPLGRDETDPRIIEYGGVDSKVIDPDGGGWRNTGCFRHADDRVYRLAETLPAFIEFLAGIKPVYCHVGSLADDPWGNHLRERDTSAYRRWLWRNTAIYRGATLSLDHCAELPSDRLEDLRTIRRQTGHSATLEGRRRRSPEFAHLNDERIGTNWMEISPFDSRYHLPLSETVGRKIAWLEPPPPGVNPTEWKKERREMLPEDVDVIVDVRDRE